MTNPEAKTARAIAEYLVVEYGDGVGDAEAIDAIAQAIEDAEKRGRDSAFDSFKQGKSWGEDDTVGIISISGGDRAGENLLIEFKRRGEEIKALSAEASVLATALKTADETIAMYFQEDNIPYDENSLIYRNVHLPRANLSPATRAAMGVIEAAVSLMTSTDPSLDGVMHTLEIVLDDAVAEYERVMGGGE